MPKISVAICCANSEDTLAAACLSVAWADELVIVDSGSHDQTAQIAKQYADQYVVEPWRGFTEQKKFSTMLCQNDWILVLDSDEECSPELALQLTAFDEQTLGRYDVIEMPRHNYVMGRHVRAWGPDWQSRFIHRHRCSWPDEALHEARLPSDPSRLKRITGVLFHKRHSEADFGDYFGGKRMDARLMMVAKQMHQRGKRCHWWDLIFRPWMAFVKFYFLKASFKDGTFGLLIAQKAALSTQLKYASLWAVQQAHPGS